MSDARVQIFGGGPILPIEGFSANVTPGSNSYTMLVDAALANRTVTLPPSASNPGRIYIVKRTDSTLNTVTVIPSGADTIDGGVSSILTALLGQTFQSDGEGLWSVLSSSGGGGGGPPTPEAATYVVSPTPGVGDFTTIEAAVAAAPAAGADIYLREGTYAPVGTIALPLAIPIRIRGAGAVGIAQITMPTAVPLFSLAAGSTAEYSFSGFKATGDLSAGQALFNIDSAVDFYGNDLEVVSCQGIVVTTTTPTVAFTECIFDMLGFDWSFWRGVTGGTLVWNYVTATHPLGFSVSAILGVPDWDVVNSYIGGAGFGTYDLGRVLWNGLKIDFADITINGPNSEINECEFSNSGITVTNVAPDESFLVSDSIFFGGGSGAFQLILTKSQNSITGCLFNGGSNIGIDLLVGATKTVISGCRFFPYVVKTLRTASTGLVAEGNTGLQVEEVGAADNNRYSDIIDGSAVIGPTSIVNDWNSRSVAVDTTLNETHRTVLVDATAGPITITLPFASARYRVYTVKKTDASANTVTIDGAGAETIDGAMTQVISSQYRAITVQSNGTSWDIIVPDASGGGADIYAATRVVSLIAGDGTDLTIAAAIAALPAEGGSIYVKQGTYVLAATLVMTDKDIKIVGTGDSTVIVAPTTVPTFSIPAAFTGRYEFDSFQVTGDNSIGQSLIDIASAVDVKFANVNTTALRDIVVTSSSPEVKFLNSCFMMTSLGTTSSFWRGSVVGGGSLTWEYVEATITTPSTDGIVGSPEFDVTASYIGGGGPLTTTFDCGKVRWQGFKVDKVRFDLIEGNNEIVNFECIDGNLAIKNARTAIANSIFTTPTLSGTQVSITGPGGAGGHTDITIIGCTFDAAGATGTNNQIDISKCQGVEITGCSFSNNGTGAGTDANIAVGSTGGTTELVVTGCRFFGGTPVQPVREFSVGGTIIGRYDSNQNFTGATIVSPFSIVNNWNTRSITTTPVTLDETHRTALVDATGGARVVNLPTAASGIYRKYTVKKIDASANTVTVDAAGAETIDGALTVVFTLQWERITIQSDGTAWFRID